MRKYLFEISCLIYVLLLWVLPLIAIENTDSELYIRVCAMVFMLGLFGFGWFCAYVDNLVNKR
jgi:hypothetical protein